MGLTLSQSESDCGVAVVVVEVVLLRSDRMAEVIRGPAAAAAARHSGGGDLASGLDAAAAAFAGLSEGGGSRAVDGSLSWEASSSSLDTAPSESSSDDVLRRRSRRLFPRSAPACGVAGSSFFFGPRLYEAASLSLLRGKRESGD